MYRRSRIAIWATCVSALVTAPATAEDEHWGYSGERGPDHWGELSDAYETCGKGHFQSPVDITDARKAELGPIALSYRGSTISAVNNGHTIQVDVGPDNLLEVENQPYALVQFHLHSPSEHRIQGKSFPLEAHFVHENDRGELAVVSVLFRDGPHHPGLSTIGVPAILQAGKKHPIVMPIANLGFVPEDRAYYRYSGSLSTPPCTEGILWLILKETGSVSKEQVATFVKVIGKDARDPQPLNGRLVFH